jgi:hypothetical protein
MDEQRLLNELAEFRRRSIAQRLARIRASFPGLWEDADRWVRQHGPCPPWDFSAGFDAEARSLMDHYDFHLGRHRPRVPDTTPRGALFCLACDLLIELLPTDGPANG